VAAPRGKRRQLVCEAAAVIHERRNIIRWIELIVTGISSLA